MQKNLFFIFIIFFTTQLYSQIIIIRTNANNSIEALTEQDIEKYGQELCNILLNYTWPTCFAQEKFHNLSDEEKNLLLSSNIGHFYFLSKSRCFLCTLFRIAICSVFPN